MTVWPVSSSDWTRNVGSSSDRANRALDSLSWSALVLGSTATWMTGSGKVSDSRMTWSSGSHSVSPVVVCLRPTAATMSPANMASRSSRVLACIWRMRPIRSLRSLVELTTPEPLVRVPE